MCSIYDIHMWRGGYLELFCLVHACSFWVMLLIIMAVVREKDACMKLGLTHLGTTRRILMNHHLGYLGLC